VRISCLAMTKVSRRHISWWATLICIMLVALQPLRAFSQTGTDRLAAIVEWYDRFKGVQDLIDATGNAVAGEPSSFQKELADVDALGSQLDRTVLPATPNLSIVSPVSAVAKEPDVRKKAIVSLKEDASKLDAHAQDLETQAQSYREMADRSRTTSRAAHAASLQLEKMLNNPMVSGVDGLFGQKLIDAWLATAMLSSKLGGISSSADFLARNFTSRAGVIKGRSDSLRAGIKSIEKVDAILSARTNAPPAVTPTKQGERTSFVEVRTKGTSVPDRKGIGSGIDTAILTGYRLANGQRIYEQAIEFKQTGANTWSVASGLTTLLSPVDNWIGSEISVFDMPASEARKAAWVIDQFNPSSASLDQQVVVGAVIDITQAAGLKAPSRGDTTLRTSMRDLRAENTNETIKAELAARDASSGRRRNEIQAHPAPPTRDHLPGPSNPPGPSPPPQPVPPPSPRPSGCGFYMNGMWVSAPCP
jgi:hypothetical protein